MTWTIVWNLLVTGPGICTLHHRSYRDHGDGCLPRGESPLFAITHAVFPDTMQQPRLLNKAQTNMKLYCVHSLLLDGPSIKYGKERDPALNAAS